MSYQRSPWSGVPVYGFELPVLYCPWKLASAVSALVSAVSAPVFAVSAAVFKVRTVSTSTSNSNLSVLVSKVPTAASALVK